MKFEVGDVFWKVLWSEEGHEMEEWRIRSIRRAPRRSPPRGRSWIFNMPLNPVTVYFVLKNEFTWVKRSSKHFDYGWDPDINDVWKASRSLEECIEKGPPEGLRTTKLQAYNVAIKKCEEDIKRYEKKYPDEWYISQLKKTLTSMKGRRTKTMKGR